MPYELTIIKCENCNSQIALRNETLQHNRAPKNRQSTAPSGAVHEGSCPKCDTPFEIWYLTGGSIQSTHIADAEIDRPEVFTGDAKVRVDNASAERAEQARQTADRQQEREERKRVEEVEREKARLKAEEEKQLAEEAASAALAKTQPVEDWDEDDDYDDDSGGSNQADLDNHADQMNPNNDAYWSSRG